MPTSFFANNRVRTRSIFVISFGIVLLLAVFVFPFSSGAKRQVTVPPAQQSSRSIKPVRAPFRPGEILVRYKSESVANSRTGAERLSTAAGEVLNASVSEFGAYPLVEGLRIVKVDPSETLKAVAAFRNQPDVIYAEPNYIFHATVTPNDPRFVAQPSMTRIGATQVWNTQQGSRSVVVGVLDQGIDINHEDLLANIWTNPSPGSVQVPGPTIAGDLHGYDFVNNSGTVFTGADTETHATHVAGIIGAVGNNNKGVAGVNWAVSLMSLKFLDEDGFGDTADAIRACNYAAQMRQTWDNNPGHTQGANVKVINASFGGAPFTQGFIDAINGLNTRGILFVAAAGNTTDTETPEPDNDRVPVYPAGFSLPNIISVAASDDSDLLATFSHFGGTGVDLAAPGTNIVSTTPHCGDIGPDPHPCNPEPPDATAQSTYSIFSGTSMSTPHVTGAAALLWAQSPNLTAAQVKSLLLYNGDVVPGLIDKTLTGRRLNVSNSFLSLAENDSTAPGAVTNFHINSQTGRTVKLGWTASGDDGAAGQASLYQINFIDGATSTVYPVKGVLPMLSGTGQIATVAIPFRHNSGTLQVQEFDNAGNAGTPVTLPISVPQPIADPFTTSVGASVALTTGGTNLNPNADDAYLDFILPNDFTFPFLQNNLTSITLSTNGNIYFGSPPPELSDGSSSDPTSSPSRMGGYQMVAGLWDDLDLRTTSRVDAGIYTSRPSPDRLIFRWQGVPCNFNGSACTGSTPVNFEIELRTNGVIKTRYGAGNTALLPTVGLGVGGQDGYPIDTHSSEVSPINLTDAGEVTFTPRAAIASTVQFAQATHNVTEGTTTLSVDVTRSGDTASFATVDYSTSDLAGSLACSAASANASSRCDYLTTLGRLAFAAGETQKTINIPIVNDVYVEGPQTFTIGLSNAIGVNVGATGVATVTINDNGGEGGVNPIDQAQFFVRQHYIDFLNREPDTAGLNFWSNEITSCGADAQCIEVKRINVSAAFYLSIEFQETGYLVYRFYKAAFGNLPGAPVPVAFSDFLRETQQIGKGVQVGIGDWQGQLEANKQAYALEFVQRTDFLTAYNNLTAQQFVDKLNTNAGNVLSTAERNDLVSKLGATPADLSKRALVLRTVAEDADLRNAETNKAFVLMQYFGYMRRSPNDAPDSNFDGFNFWLGKLNSFGGNFVNAEMVKAFIVSDEYRKRFGP